MRVLFVGCGEIGMLGHLPALRTLGDEGVLELVAVCDLDERRAEQAARRFGVPAWGSDWAALARDCRADAVSVCLPPGPNADVAAEAVGMGLHVLCEKPPGRDASQAARMAAAAASRPDRVTMIAFNRRFAPLYLQAIARSRDLGAPHAFFGRFTRDAMGSSPSNTVADWITSDSSHALDLAIATIGFPNTVTVARERSGPGPDNVWTLHLSSVKASAVLLLSYAAGRRLERFEWAGPGYDVVLELPERAVWSQTRCDPDVWASAELTGTSEFFVNYGFLDEYRAFLGAVRGGEKPEPDFTYGLRFMKLVGQILESANGGTFRVGNSASHPNPVIDPGSAAAVVASAGAARAARPVVQILQSPEAVRRYFLQEHLSDLGESCQIEFHSGNSDGLPDLSGTEVLLLGWGAPPVPAAALAAAQRLKLVVVLGASIQWALDPAILLDRKVPICNTAGAIARSVAEHCLLLTLAGLRRLPQVSRDMRVGGWPPRSTGKISVAALARRAARLPFISPLKPVLRPMRDLLFPAHTNAASRTSAWTDLHGAVVGLVGWGTIAREFARLLQPFACELLVVSDFATEAELGAFGARRADLGEVMSSARVVSLHKGLTPRTQGLLDRHKLAMLRRGSVLVNTARGPLIEETALIERARRGDVVIALDVFHQEPLPRRHPLRKLPNVILSPHSAAATPQCERRVGSDALEIVRNWMEGKPVPALSAERLATMT